MRRLSGAKGNSMNTLARPTTMLVQGAGLTCSVCGRPVGPDAVTVKGLGKLGSDCAKRYAGFEKFLEHHGLETYLEEQTIEAVRIGDDWLVPKPLLELEFIAKTLGLIILKEFLTKAEPYQIKFRLEHRHTKQARDQFQNAYRQWANKTLMNAELNRSMEAL